MHGAYLRALQSTYMKMPVKGSLLWATLPEERIGPKPMEKAIKAMQVRMCTCVPLSLYMQVCVCTCVCVCLCVCIMHMHALHACTHARMFMCTHVHAGVGQGGVQAGGGRE